MPDPKLFLFFNSLGVYGRALATGLNGKNNVFIPNINDYKTNTFQKVVVFVPGIMATVERRPNDSLVVTKLELSDEYKNIERGSTEKPGVYTVNKDRNNLTLNYKNNGRITPKDDRKVAIANTEYGSPLDAATEVAKRLGDMFGSNAGQKGEFDLFYSPSGSRLKGRKNYNPSLQSKNYAFGGLLADAIEQSQKQKGVEWVSERAGSVVLSQALMILSNKGLDFTQQRHLVKMCWATANPGPAYTAAMQLGMLPDKGLLNSNSSIRASLGAMLGNAARARNLQDHYSWSDYGKDLATGSMSVNAAAGVAALGGSTLVGLPLFETAGTAVGVVGAIQFGYKVIKNRMSRN